MMLWEIAYLYNLHWVRGNGSPRSIKKATKVGKGRSLYPGSSTDTKRLGFNSKHILGKWSTCCRPERAALHM